MSVKDLSQEVDRKFIDTIDTNEWEVETEDGWQDIHSVSKTIEYEVWELHTANNLSLKCADNHIVFTDTMDQVFVKDLVVGQSIITKFGTSTVKSVTNLGVSDNMYDISVDSKEHSYYTNGILSHNSMTTGVYALHKALYTEPKKPVKIYILSNKAKSAKEFLDKIKVTYEELEPYLKKGVLEWNKTSVKFEDGSEIITGATTIDSIRGSSVSVLILDEFAHILPHIAEEFFTSAEPTVSTGGQLIMISTPKGTTGEFYRIYRNAEKGIGEFVPFKVEWDEVPGRDEAFKEKRIKDAGLIKFLQEYACIQSYSLIKIQNVDTKDITTISIEDLYDLYDSDRFQIETSHGWVDFDGVRQLPDKQRLYEVVLENGLSSEVTYSHEFVVKNNPIALKNLSIGDYLETIKGNSKIVNIIDTGREEYVYDILHSGNDDHSFIADGINHHNCSFIGSTVTLIEGSVIEKLRDYLPDEPILSQPNMEYYNKCLDDHLYLFSVDVSKGVGADYSVIQIIDITNPDLAIQAAVFFDNFMDPFKLTLKIIELSKEWNNPYVIVEVNAYGDEVVRRLWHEFEYENLFYEKRQHRKGHGVYADKRTKSIGTSMFKKHVEGKQILIQDVQTVTEIEGFVELRPDIYGCEQGENSHDDRVMALVWASYFIESPYWKELEPYVRKESSSSTNKNKNIEDEEDSYTPIVVDVNPVDRDADGFIWG